MALRPEAAPAARASRRLEVQRSVHARVSWQYHRMSPQAWPPSGTIWFGCSRIPHIQHETTAGPRAAKPAAEGARSSSAIIALPPATVAISDYGSKMNSCQPGLAAGSTTAGWHANPRLAPSSDDPVRAHNRSCPIISPPSIHPSGSGPLVAGGCDYRSVSDETAPVEIPAYDPTATELELAVHGGDIDTIRRLLAEDPRLARAGLVDRKGGFRTLLHLVADWPCYFPNGPQIVHLLIQAGADPSFRHSTRCDETALHWAASSDDVDVAAALIDGGADINVPGGSIGTPLANAVGYGCWHVARLLVARGARIGSLWEAAGLGDQAAVDEFLAADPPPASSEVDEAFYQACHGGQRRMAEYLLAQGANINTIPEYSNETPLQAAGGTDTRRQILVDWLKERGAAQT
jgi:hypothetical protein